jgi:xanthine dehydrogenase molybdenum-binding subunit
MSTKTDFSVVGTRPVRPDGLDKVTGRANYGADLALPGMLYGKVLRSPHAHARIRGIDTTAASALPGVRAVVTGADFPSPGGGIAASGETPASFRDLARNFMARDKVLYHGHAVAAVAATTTHIAQQALRLIEVDYEVLPHVLDVRVAMAKGAPILHEDLRTTGLADAPDEPTNIGSYSSHQRGDLEAGFAAADVVVEHEYFMRTVHQGYIEPHACVARWSEDEQTMVWASSQGHFMIRENCANLLGMDASQIKVIPAEIGGGFGAKTTVYLEPVAIVLSRKSGRPIKMVMTREEVFRATGPAPGSLIRFKMGATKGGTITAAQAHMVYEAGAFRGAAVGAGMQAILAPYDVPNFLIEGYDVCVNKPSSTAYRAPGAPNGAHAGETVVDELAEKLGIDPIDFRKQNASKEGGRTVTGAKWPCIGLDEVLAVAAQHSHYAAPLGANQGRGVAVGWWANGGGRSSAYVQLNEDGTASLVEGSPDIGGSRAVMQMIAAEELGIDLDKVRPVIGDTDSVPYTGVTGGSRVAFATGWAVGDAAKDVVKQLRERAALYWEIDVERVTWDNGRAMRDGGESLSLQEIAAAAGSTGGSIVGKASINAVGAAPAFCAHIVDVAVDPETGKVDVLRYTTIQDAGKALHPSYVEGQMQGGAVQGIGWALNEEFIFDADGKLTNPGFLDYRMPVSLDLPMIDAVIVEVPNPAHPYGVRGVGEAPIVPPLAAIANAIYHATGARLTETPMSPPRVLAALDALHKVPEAAGAPA